MTHPHDTVTEVPLDRPKYFVTNSGTTYNSPLCCLPHPLKLTLFPTITFLKTRVYEIMFIFSLFNDAASNSDSIDSNVCTVVNMELALGRRPRDDEVAWHMSREMAKLAVSTGDIRCPGQ